MGSGESKEVHHYHTEYIPDPETVESLRVAQNDIENLEKEARELGDPNHFSNNIGKLFNNFIEKTKSLTLTDIIKKQPGEIHVGFIGPVTAGKTTMCNAMYGTNEAVALGHCTTDCDVIYTENNLVVWDMFGADNDFKYYDPKTLSFIRNLDYCVVLFDSDIAVVSWIIKTIYTINPDALIVVRTKVDQCKLGSERSIEEEKTLDQEKLKKLLDLDTTMKSYCVSSHNIAFGEGERYDWDDLKKIVYPDST